jgi:hypothetical protein
MGETSKTRDQYDAFINEQSMVSQTKRKGSVWRAQDYHLLDNNCNNFTDMVCQFLVGKKIPAHITGLPADFLNR